jgi:multidrug resistance efflux pump
MSTQLQQAPSSVPLRTDLDVRAAQADGRLPADQAAPSPRPKESRRVGVRRILLVVLPILVLLGGFLGYGMYREGLLYVSTENAQVAGQPVQVGSMNAGRVSRIDVLLGSAVRRNDVLASVALPSQTGIAQNGQPKLGFMGLADTQIDVLAPLDGVVLALPAPVGATVAAGQPIVTIVDPSHLWVNANIEETSIGRVRVGQAVQVHVDGLNEDVAGRVEAITPATAGTFSLLPTNSASGNFTKVVQLVPVRISLFLGNRAALLGSSAEVKVRVAD